MKNSIIYSVSDPIVLANSIYTVKTKKNHQIFREENKFVMFLLAS